VTDQYLTDLEAALQLAGEVKSTSSADAGEIRYS